MSLMFLRKETQSGLAQPIYRRQCALLLILIVFFFSSFSAFSQSKADLEKQRKKLQKEIQEINQLLFQSKAQEKDLLIDLRDLNKRINVRNELIRTIDQEIGELNRDIAKNEKQVSQLEGHLNALKKEYAQMVVQSYKSRAKQSQLMFLLSSESFLQAYKRIQYIDQYAEYQKKQGEEITTETIKLQNLNDLLKEKKGEKLELVAENKKENDSITKEKVSQEKVIKSIKQKEKEYTAKIKEKQREEERIERELEKIIRDAIASSNKAANKSTVAKGTKSSGFTLTPEARDLENNFVSNKGKLPSPVEKGIVVRHFGKQPHPTLKGITIESNGVFFATEKGAPARAIFNGKVLAIQVLPGNKKAVLVQHGNYISVYKNLDNVLVNKGDQVKTKQNLGTIHTDAVTGQTILAFVLFKEINRENPEEWVYKI
jgi:septal ring factor EnvC (AmiA/AmiB activator)